MKPSPGPNLPESPVRLDRAGTGFARVGAGLLFLAAAGWAGWRFLPGETPSFGTLDQDLAALQCETPHTHDPGIEAGVLTEALERVRQQICEEGPSASLLSQQIHLGLQVDPVAAIDACQLILDRDPDNAFALGHLASAYLMQGRDQTALRYAAQLEEVQPGPQAWNLIATVFMNQGEPGKAREFFRKTLDARPGDPHATEGLRMLDARDPD